MDIRCLRLCPSPSASLVLRGLWAPLPSPLEKGPVSWAWGLARCPEGLRGSFSPAEEACVSQFNCTLVPPLAPPQNLRRRGAGQSHLWRGFSRLLSAPAATVSKSCQGSASDPTRTPPLHPLLPPPAKPLCAALGWCGGRSLTGLPVSHGPFRLLSAQPRRWACAATPRSPQAKVERSPWPQGLGDLTPVPHAPSLLRVCSFRTSSSRKPHPGPPPLSHLRATCHGLTCSTVQPSPREWTAGQDCLPHLWTHGSVRQQVPQ